MPLSDQPESCADSVASAVAPYEADPPIRDGSEEPGVSVVGSPPAPDGGICWADTMTCFYREHELVADSGRAGVIADLLGVAVAELGALRPDGGGDIDVNLSLYSVDMDPLQAAATLANPGIAEADRVAASPNYVYGFEQNRPKFAPGNTPEAATKLIPEPLSTDDLQVEVVDTGWKALSRQSQDDVELQSSSLDGLLTTAFNPFTVGPPAPAPISEVLEGRDAGHGTFIVNLLHRLLPRASITVAAIPPRFEADDGFVPPVVDGGAVSIRDDASVTFGVLASLTNDLDENLDYLNLSFGTYGCTEAAASLDAEADPNIGFFAPLGMRRVLDGLADRSGDGDTDPSTEVFAAAGNDAQRPDHPVLFFPAAWALPVRVVAQRRERSVPVSAAGHAR